MTNLADSAALGAGIAMSLIVGAAVAAFVKLPERVAASLTAFGGGVLLAAVALELVPEAGERAGTLLTALALLAGTALYVGADAWLTRDTHAQMIRRSGHAAASGRDITMSPDHEQADHEQAARGEAIAAGLVVDGIPESIALGLTLTEGGVGLALLAGILVGNTVEAYGATHPIVEGGHSRRFAIGLLAGIGVALASATILGGTLLAEASDTLVGIAQAVASGAVLAVISISIIPYAFDEVSRWAAFASALGFAAGYVLS